MSEQIPTQELQRKFNLSKAVGTDFNPLGPENMEYLPFQKAGIEYAIENKNVLFADQPGLGKTIQAIGVLNHFNIKRALVICPTSLVSNWKKEIDTWHVMQPKVYEIKSGSQVLPFDPDIFVCPFSMLMNSNVLKFLITIFKYEYLIIDEVHYLKNIKAKRTTAVYGRGGLVDQAQRVIAISGTPIVNKPIELYSTLKKLCPQAIDNMNKFQYGMKYCGGYKNRWGWDFTGASNLKELGKRLRCSFMVRRMKRNVLKDLPDKMINIVYLDQNPKSKKLIAEMMAFEDRKMIKVDSHSFDEISTLRAELGEDKLAKSVEYIKTQLECGHKKIIVFAHHKSVLKSICVELKEFGVASITGDTSTHYRQVEVDRFQNDESVRIFVGSITAAGVGLTLTASSYVVFVEPSYVPGENEQAIDRAHRIGQKDSVLAEFLVYEGSLDERILNANIRKMRNIRKVME